MKVASGQVALVSSQYRALSLLPRMVADGSEVNSGVLLHLSSLVPTNAAFHFMGCPTDTLSVASPPTPASPVGAHGLVLRVHVAVLFAAGATAISTTRGPAVTSRWRVLRGRIAGTHGAPGATAILEQEVRGEFLILVAGEVGFRRLLPAEAQVLKPADGGGLFLGKLDGVLGGATRATRHASATHGCEHLGHLLWAHAGHHLRHLLHHLGRHAQRLGHARLLLRGHALHRLEHLGHLLGVRGAARWHRATRAHGRHGTTRGRSRRRGNGLVQHAEELGGVGLDLLEELWALRPDLLEHGLEGRRVALDEPAQLVELRVVAQLCQPTWPTSTRGRRRARRGRPGTRSRGPRGREVRRDPVHEELDSKRLAAPHPRRRLQGAAALRLWEAHVHERTHILLAHSRGPACVRGTSRRSSGSWGRRSRARAGPGLRGRRSTGRRGSRGRSSSSSSPHWRSSSRSRSRSWGCCLLWLADHHHQETAFDDEVLQHLVILQHFARVDELLVRHSELGVRLLDGHLGLGDRQRELRLDGELLAIERLHR
mmetsp:Transcript_11433/g.32894  ORF Transcript_11433/g.32894 Transcript_11433/m.32894 type:complete len:541 (-) Transcript_11433:34-1656(-)